MEHDIRISQGQSMLAEMLADDIVKMVGANKTYINPFSLALSGGRTPDLLFSVLGKKYNDEKLWKNTAFFWVDERCVPPDDPESNFRKAFELFFKKTDIDHSRIHRIRGEDNPVQEAGRYSAEIAENTVLRNGWPLFNLVLLGLGEDGHTASIFPGNEKLFESSVVCEVARHPVTLQERVTITGRVINNAELVFFLAAGRSKAQIVSKILLGSADNELFPASLVKPVNGKVVWYLDQEAADEL